MYYPSAVPDVKKIFYNFSIFILVIFSATSFQLFVYADNKRQIADDYRLKGYEQQQQGNLDGALNWYFKAVSFDPGYAVALNDIGLLYEQLGIDDRAEQSYLAAIKADKRYLPPYSNLGYFYKKKQNLVQAIQYFRIRVESGSPGDEWTSKAKAELKSIFEHSPYLKKKLVNRAAQVFERQLVREARAKFDQQIASARSYYRQGERFLNQKKYHDAVKLFDSAMAITPEDPKIIRARHQALHAINQQMIEQHVEQAMKLLKEGNATSAQKRFREVLTIIPDGSNPKAEK